ncbi:MAG: copper chaperone Copz family protein [Candidatus Latescibacteria bacterium]|nr:copper chaperone Copz family protein [Candidatus Latescibacterota bacterium]
MSNCCTVPTTTPECCVTVSGDADASPVCRICGQKAKPVDRITPEHLLKPEAAVQLRGTVYHFCATPTCDVVYFSNATGQYFHKGDVTVRVGMKEIEDPIPICYCFDYTVRHIEDEIRTTGATTIPERIRAEVKAGHCRCEVMNPQGTCCLGNVARTVKKAMAAVQIPVGIGG